MHTTTDLFGPVYGDSDQMAAAAYRNPTTDAAPVHASTEATLAPSHGRGLLDPKGSAVFWVGLAAIIGLGLVSGQLKVSAALKGGRK